MTFNAYCQAMKVGLLASLAIHAMIFTALLWPTWKREKHSHVTSIEMVSLLNPVKSQRQRIKGSKRVAPQKPMNKEDVSLKKMETTAEKLGNDKEDAPEIQGGTNNPQLLAVATYAQELQQYIARNRYYPRRAMIMEQTGVVKVRLKINSNGQFTQVEVIEPSPHALLNQAAQDLVSELGSFKPLPKAYRGNGEFIVPINYQLGGGI